MAHLPVSLSLLYLHYSQCPAYPPASATAAHPPARPPPALQQCLIDRSNYVFYWPVAREAGRHFIVSRAKGEGKNGYCSLSGKDDGRLF